MTFEHLLGLSLEDALALLRGYRIFTPDVVWTQAPGDGREGGEARVISVSGDGQRLVVSRFFTEGPKRASPGAEGLK